MKICARIPTVLCILCLTSGDYGTEVHSPLGIEMCKEKCLLRSDCLVIMYDITHVACETSFKAKQAKHHGTIFVISRNDIRETKQYCNNQCKHSSCVLTRSSKQVCVVPGCRQCQILPSMNGVVANPTCHDHFSSPKNQRKRIQCYKNCKWESSDFDCKKANRKESTIPTYHPRQSREGLKKTKRLPAPLTQGCAAVICGKIGTPKEFSIDFKNGRDRCLHLHPIFTAPDRSGKANRRFLVYSDVKGRRSRGVRATGKDFPFEWNTQFCLTVSRMQQKYKAAVNGHTFSIPYSHKGAATVIVARQLYITSVKMTNKYDKDRPFSKMGYCPVAVAIAFVITISNDSLALRLSELHPLTGIERCQELCLRQADCVAIIYSITHIACDIRFKLKTPSNHPENTVFIIRERMALPPKMYCDRSPCKSSSCIETRSYKQICVVRGCPDCQSPPEITDTQVVVTQLLHGALAEYTCRLNYSSQNHTSKSLSCFKNCTWETTYFGCRNVHDNTARLGKPLRVNMYVHVCGTVKKPEEFGINFITGQDYLLHINPRFNKRSIYGRTVNQILLTSYIRGKWGRKVQSKRFPFKWNSKFCMTVTRKRKAYKVTVKKIKYFLPVQLRRYARVVQGNHCNLTQVTLSTC